MARGGERERMLLTHAQSHHRDVLEGSMGRATEFLVLPHNIENAGYETSVQLRFHVVEDVADVIDASRVNLLDGFLLR